MRVVVGDARGAAAADAAAIAAGIPARALMQRAGAAAAAEITMRFPRQLALGVVVATGPGNNGGDGWVIARALRAIGVAVRVVQCAETRSPDAMAERALAIADGIRIEQGAACIPVGGEHLAVDALLGTGYSAQEPLRADMANAIAQLTRFRERGGEVIALDIPSGLDATTGVAQGELHASLTLVFGTLKRGLLSARARAGTIVVLDIGLGTHAQSAGSAFLATVDWFAEQLPAIPDNAHKGTRRKVVIIGGAEGMAGAVILAVRAALRSGAGLVKALVAEPSLLALQKSEPAALAASWPQNGDDWAREVGQWADVVLLGPGLGRGSARAMVENALAAFRGPVVLDADALNAFEGKAGLLAPLLVDRAALLTPHPLEFARLAGRSVVEIVTPDVVHAMARDTAATVLLKGTPTIVASPAGQAIFIAEGNAILATGGSGDVLGGIAATLLAQTGDAMRAGALAAFAHGRAASLVSGDSVRGHTMDDVLAALPRAWSVAAAVPRAPVLAELQRASPLQ